MSVRGMAKLVIACLVLFAVGAAFAQSQPAAKATAQVGEINVFSTELDAPEVFRTIMTNTVKTSQQKDLFLSVSLECGLSTKTVVKSKGGNRETSTADAGIELRVLVDGVESEPGVVTFCRRTQELSATFQGIIDGCSVDENGVLVLDENCLLDEEIELVQRSVNASSFNFVHPDCGQGVHTVEVQARMNLSEGVDDGSVEARATMGKGSLTIEEVRLSRGQDIEM